MERQSLPKRPPVVIWYMIYCVLMAIGYALFSLYIAFLIWLPKEQVTAQVPFAGKAVLVLETMWGSLLSGTIVLMLYFIAVLFFPRKPWAWVCGIVAISVGLVNCCCLPLSIPVFVLWLKPETKNYYGWGERAHINGGGA